MKTGTWRAAGGLPSPHGLDEPGVAVLWSATMNQVGLELVHQQLMPGAISLPCPLVSEAGSSISSGFPRWGSSFRNLPPHGAKDQVASKESEKAQLFLGRKQHPPSGG